MKISLSEMFRDVPPACAVLTCPAEVPVVSKVLRAFFAKKVIAKCDFIEQPYKVEDKDSYKKISLKVKNVDTGRLRKIPLVPGEIITLRIKKKTFNLSFTSLDEATIGDKVFIVVETVNLRSSSVTVQIAGSNNTTFVAPGETISILQGGTEKESFTATVGEYAKKTKEFANAAQFADMAILEVELKPGTPKKTEEWSRKINASAEKAACLHLLVTASSGNQIEYATEEELVPSPSSEKGIFLNREKRWFQLKGCFCDRDFHADDMLAIIYMLRDKEKLATYRETFFDKQRTDMLSSLSCGTGGKLRDHKDKIKLFTDEMNAMFAKFGINTCKRKVHFIAQMYLETMNFRASSEALGICEGYGGGCDFRGRGMKQITHDYNYLAYFDYVKGTDFFRSYMNAKKVDAESVGDTIGRNKILTTSFYEELKAFARTLASDLFLAMDSGGWYSTINRKKTLVEMDKGLDDANVKSVTYEINGGYNDLAKRQNYTKWLRTHFKFDSICATK